MFRFQSQPSTLNREDKYPQWGIILVLALNFLSPFVTNLLVYPAFLICIYRIIRYDEKVFATDYCILQAVSLLFTTSGGMSLLVYLCLFAAVWYFIRRGIRGEAAVVLVVALLNFLLMRMQFEVSKFVLCFGQLFLLYVLIPQQDEWSAERCARAFCFSLLLSSAYALAFRNTSQIAALRGYEVPAFWGSSIMRFYGLFQDPNYYAMLLITSLSLLIKLKDCKCVTWPVFIIGGLLLIACGILTYSKTFFLMLIVVVFIYLVWQFWNKRVLRGILLTLLIVVAGGIILFAEGSPFAVVLSRLTSSTNLDELTTGRSELFMTYYNAIVSDPVSILFGKGLAAGNLGRDPHNLFLEITYYIGLTGLVLMVTYFGILIHGIVKSRETVRKQNFVSKYAVVLVVVVLHVTLHGMTSLASYVSFFVAAVSMMVTRKQEDVQ